MRHCSLLKTQKGILPETEKQDRILNFLIHFKMQDIFFQGPYLLIIDVTLVYNIIVQTISQSLVIKTGWYWQMKQNCVPRNKPTHI